MLALLISLVLSTTAGEVVDSPPAGFTSQITASPDGVRRGRIESLAAHVERP